MEQQGSNKQFFVTKFVFKIHLAANDEERRGKKPRKNKEKIQFIYLTLKLGKKTISRKVIDEGQFSFFVSCT